MAIRCSVACPQLPERGHNRVGAGFDEGIDEIRYASLAHRADTSIAG